MTRTICIRLASTLLTGLLIATTGCGDKTEVAPPPSGMHPVKGKVKSEVGSVTGFTITFHPKSAEARASSGEVKADGSFELHTLLPNDGASDGEYKVFFVPPLGNKRSSAIPTKFQNAEETDVTATIKPDTTDLGTITLKK